MRGFTIVELLIVIVVIGILAAIVIVAYNGVTARANTTKNQTGASSLQKKAEAYYNDSLGGNGLYPPTTATTTPGWRYYTTNNTSALGAIPTGITIQPGAPTGATAISTLQYVACASNNTANSNTASGFYIGYWNFSTSAINYYIGGVATGTQTGGVYTSASCPAGTAASTT